MSITRDENLLLAMYREARDKGLSNAAALGELASQLADTANNSVSFLWRETTLGNPVSVYPVPNSRLYPKVSGTYAQTGAGDPSPENIRPITPWLASGGAVNIVQTDGATITLTAPQEIAAGWMDNEGKGQVTWVRQVLNGTENISFQAQTNYSEARLTLLYPTISGTTHKASHFKSQWASNFYASYAPNANAMWFIVPRDPYSTVEIFKSFLAAQYAAGTPVTICYQLATPIALTPAIAPLTAAPQLDRVTPRQNVLTASTGNVELTYAKSPIQQANELEAAITTLGGIL